MVITTRESWNRPLLLLQRAQSIQEVICDLGGILSYWLSTEPNWFHLAYNLSLEHADIVSAEETRRGLSQADRPSSARATVGLGSFRTNSGVSGHVWHWITWLINAALLPSVPQNIITFLTNETSCYIRWNPVPTLTYSLSTICANCSPFFSVFNVPFRSLNPSSRSCAENLRGLPPTNASVCLESGWIVPASVLITSRMFHE